MTTQQPAGYDEAVKAVHANMSPRAHRMAQLERFVEGTQYEGLPNFWAADAKVPLVDRAPCIVYPIVRSAIDSNVDLLLGEGRFPTLSARPDEDGDIVDDGELSEEESATIDAFIRQVHKQSRFRVAAREMFAAGQASGSACALLGVRSGKLFVETVKARWCEPEFDIDGNVTRLVIQYPYVETVRVSGQWQSKARVYRRVIDDQNDVTMLPAEGRADGGEIAWRKDAARSVTHGLGFCPVVWYAHMRGCVAFGDYDGKAIHEQLLDEIKALDMTLSQRQRAAYYAGDPQWTEAGVELGSSPTGGGRRGRGIMSTPAGGRPSDDNPVNGRFADPLVGSKARKKSPGDVWQYESPDTKVQLHTLPGDALKAIDDTAHDLRQKIAESLCVVFMDPENVKFAATVSGKALEVLKQRQLDRCDQYRADFGERFILPATNMLLRIVAKVKLGARVPGIKRALPILTKIGGSDEGAHVAAA